MAELTALPPCRRLVLCGRAPALAAAAAPLGFALPKLPCHATTVGDRAALWLGPDEVLLLAPLADPLPAALAAALQGLAHSLVDVSQRQVALRLRGPDAADMLNAGCPLDLHPEAFPVEMCTRTVFAKAQIILWRNEIDTFRLEIVRSFVPYIHAMLEEAAVG